MLPTLMGRIQTRIFATLFIGGLWALVIAPVLPNFQGAPYSLKWKTEFGLLIIIAALGVLWELLYHGLMQFRWEKDWPTLFGLATLVNEGILVYFVAHEGIVDAWWIGYSEGIPTSTFLTAFLTTWIVVWLWVNGPMRIFTVHWRFRGGRLL